MPATNVPSSRSSLCQDIRWQRQRGGTGWWLASGQTGRLQFRLSKRQGYGKLFHGVARWEDKRVQDRSHNECGRRRKLTQRRPENFPLNPELR
jgi:hypothetical protein